MIADAVEYNRKPTPKPVIIKNVITGEEIHVLSRYLAGKYIYEHATKRKITDVRNAIKNVIHYVNKETVIYGEFLVKDKEDKA